MTKWELGNPQWRFPCLFFIHYYYPEPKPRHQMKFLFSIILYKNPITLWTPSTSKYTNILIHTNLHGSLNTINSMVFKILCYCVKCKNIKVCTGISEVLIWSGLCKRPCRDYAEKQQFHWRAAILLESRAFGVRSKWSKDPARRLRSGSDESPGARAVRWQPRGQSRVLWVCRGCCASPSAAAAASPEHPVQNLGNALGQHRATNACSRNRELWHCLTEQPASSSYIWFPRKLNEMKRRSIAFCFEVLNQSFPVSPAGTKRMEWRQTAW